MTSVLEKLLICLLNNLRKSLLSSLLKYLMNHWAFFSWPSNAPKLLYKDLLINDTSWYVPSQCCITILSWLLLSQDVVLIEYSLSWETSCSWHLIRLVPDILFLPRLLWRGIFFLWEAFSLWLHWLKKLFEEYIFNLKNQKATFFYPSFFFWSKSRSRVMSTKRTILLSILSWALWPSLFSSKSSLGLLIDWGFLRRSTRLVK